MKKPTRAAPFFGLNDRMPVILALILGFQHALAMLAGIITPPISMSDLSRREEVSYWCFRGWLPLGYDANQRL